MKTKRIKSKIVNSDDDTVLMIRVVNTRKSTDELVETVNEALDTMRSEDISVDLIRVYKENPSPLRPAEIKPSSEDVPTRNVVVVNEKS